MDLVIASTNLAKVHELKRFLQKSLSHQVRIRSLVDFPTYVHPTDGTGSFEERATCKAIHAAQQLQLPCIADESGLVVPALGGYPESFRRKQLQARGTRLPDTKRLLADLSHSADETNRTAFLECAIAFACPKQGLVRTASARMEGLVASQEAGAATFDFASIFVKNDYRKTLAELPPSALDAISHRRKACEKLVPALRLYFTPAPRVE